jgi:ubiquinone/menaquinone biosynthesis C-methylase UbiE
LDHLQRVKQEFTRQAGAFASSPAITDAQLTRRFSEAIGLNGNGVILDVACGPGIVTAALAEKAREVVALDVTPEMLSQARQRCAKAGLTNVTFREGSATALPFPDSSFDGVVTRLSIHHFEEPRRALDEMFRVLRPDGALIVADVVSSENAEESALQNAIETLRDPSHVRMLAPSELLSLIEGAGFQVETQSTWDKDRELGEWMGIINDPARVAPLRTVVRALATAGATAGLGLSRAGGEVVLFHRWLLIAARKADPRGVRR